MQTRYSQTVEIASIRAEAQCRTRNGFDRESLMQLGASLRDQWLQPVTLRPSGPEFIIIAGHRRIAAARLVGLTHAPAIIDTEATPETIVRDQAAENLQRENLCLLDRAELVRRLYDANGKNQKAVAAILRKSQPWVSKMLALTKPGFSPEVQALAEMGVTGDVETLLDLDKIIDHKAEGAEKIGRALIAGMIDGSTSREAIRKALSDLNNPPTKAEPKPAASADDGDTDADDENADEQGTIAEPSAKSEAVATADAHLSNVALPTFTQCAVLIRETHAALRAVKVANGESAEVIGQLQERLMQFLSAVK